MSDNTNDKNYVGKGWLRTFDNGGSIISLQLTKALLENLPVNEYGQIKLIVAQRRERDEKSKATHYVIEDTYRREGEPTTQRTGTGVLTVPAPDSIPEVPDIDIDKIQMPF